MVSGGGMMEALLLRYWQLVAGFVLGAVLAGWVGWQLHGWRVETLEGRYKAEANKAITAAAAQCRDNQKLTEGIAREYHKQIDNLGRRLADAKRVYGNRCIRPVPVAGTAGGGDAAARAGHVDPDGVAVGDFLDYGGDAERYRRQLMACQQFIRQTWALNGQP